MHTDDKESIDISVKRHDMLTCLPDMSTLQEMRALPLAKLSKSEGRACASVMIRGMLSSQ